ncbi:MAG: hypothetical protein HFH87_17285 [Lachnospiraceae bacterium]|nr:hypothetical protein [Lachnospiraceae bacterium]
MNRMKRMKKVRKGGFPATVLFLTLITVFCSAGTAMSRSDLSIQELEGYYHEKEQELVDEAKELLEAKGFANSGVMLTRVVDREGRREYTITVHHGKITRLCEEEQTVLMSELEKIVFEDENSVFNHRFIY